MVTVFGLGFVGLTTALSFAHLGYKVYGIDVDKERLRMIRDGNLPFHEPNMDEVLKKEVGKRFIPTDNVQAAVRDSDYIFYCVGTPYGENGAADLSYLFKAIDQTVASIDDDCYRVLITKSTIPPSTTREKIVPYIQNKGEVAKQIGVANNPEFLREGHCWDDVIHADRIVVGCEDSRAIAKIRILYEPIANIPLFMVSYSTGEFIKYLSNTFLATMISYSNEMAEIADKLGQIDIANAFRILHMDSRWNGCSMTSYIYPGCGYGGYCLPKDTNALYAQSREKGFVPSILREVIQTNEKRPAYMAKRICHVLKGKNKVGILGLAFKPDSDDVRDTPAAKIIKAVLAEGNIEIYAYDPLAMQSFIDRYPELPVTLCVSMEEVVEKADVLAITTAWPIFKSVDTYEKPLIDCRYMR